MTVVEEMWHAQEMSISRYVIENYERLVNDLGAHDLNGLA